MSESGSVERRRQFCSRCGQPMFEFYRSPDGHFGLAGTPEGPRQKSNDEIHCPTCSAPYRLLDRVNAMGWPVERT